jgi:hypothetical protein
MSKDYVAIVSIMLEEQNLVARRRTYVESPPYPSVQLEDCTGLVLSSTSVERSIGS